MDGKLMNWKLIFQLSLFGLGMAFATVFLIPPKIEPLFWLPIFLACAIIIAKRCATRRFLHGLLLGLVNCVWITSAHIFFANRYLAGHLQEAAALQSMPAPTHPRLMMANMGAAVGILSGILIGLLALAAGKITRARNRNQTPACGGVLP